MKLQDTLSNKDKIINEFSKLSENTKSKFKMFEDANRILQEENEILNRTIDEYKNSLIPRLIQSEYLKEKRIVPECVIMLTDGYVGSDWGRDWTAPVLWAIVGGNDCVADNGKTILVKD